MMLQSKCRIDRALQRRLDLRNGATKHGEAQALRRRRGALPRERAKRRDTREMVARRDRRTRARRRLRAFARIQRSDDFVHQAAPQLVQLPHRHEEIAIEFVGEIRKLESAAAEPAELLAQDIRIQSMGTRG